MGKCILPASLNQTVHFLLIRLGAEVNKNFFNQSNLFQFGMNEVFTKKLYDCYPFLKKSDSDTKTLAIARSACGAPAAVLATLTSYPFDVIRTRDHFYKTFLPNHTKV